MSVVRWGVLWGWTAGCIGVALLCVALTLRREVALALARRLWAPGALWICGLRLRVEREGAVDWGAPHVFVMNHESVADIPAGFLAVPVNLRFVAKKAFAYLPFVGLYMWATGMIFVERSRPRKAYASLQRAAERIRGGVSILTFPEGTRSREGGIRSFKRGAFVLAQQAGVPVVPLVVAGARERMPADGLWIWPGPIRVRVGTPIRSRPGESPEELAERVRGRMLGMRAEMEGAQSLANEASFCASTLPNP